MKSPCISVVVEGAVISAARLFVVLFVVVGAHVKDGEQTACRHNLIFAHLWCVFEQPPLSSFKPLTRKKRQQQQVTSKAMKFIVPHRMWLLQHDDDDDDDNSNQRWGSSSTGGSDVGKYGKDNNNSKSQHQ